MMRADPGCSGDGEQCGDQRQCGQEAAHCEYFPALLPRGRLGAGAAPGRPPGPGHPPRPPPLLWRPLAQGCQEVQSLRRGVRSGSSCIHYSRQISPHPHR